jgi:hypothetical protein
VEITYAEGADSRPAAGPPSVVAVNSNQKVSIIFLDFPELSGVAQLCYSMNKSK